MTIDTINILTYFIIYSFLGWLLESIVKTFIEKRLVNSGFLHGPLCPIYGMGAIIMYLGLSYFKAYPVLVFISAFFILSIWEYIVGFGLEKMFNTKYWDYTNNRFNIKGRVCLMNSIFWGILGVVYIYIINPFVESKITLIPKSILIYILIIVYAYVIVDAVISIVKVKNITIKFNKIKEIGEIIKDKLESLENIKNAEMKQNSIESLQKVIDELKLKQNRLKQKLYRHTYRLKKAFPTMKSEVITEILNEKIKSLKRNKKTKE